LSALEALCDYALYKSTFTLHAEENNVPVRLLIYSRVVQQHN